MNESASSTPTCGGQRAPASPLAPTPEQRDGPAPLAHFAQMIDHCLDYATAAKAQGHPVVGIMCEYTPREVLLAAGAVPVCLCGGSAATIPAAEQSLPTNLCPLIKSTFGYHVQRSNPFLELADLVVAETTCDGKKKMFELMGLNRPMWILELPHKADTPAALDAWTAEVKKFAAHVEARFGVTLTVEKLRAAIQRMNRERDLRRRLAGLLARDPPPLTGRELLQFSSLISGMEADLVQYERAWRWYSARRGPPAAARAKPVRLLLTGVPTVHGAERVVEIIEASGAVVVCTENCTGLKPLLEDVDPQAADPLAAIARKYEHLPCSIRTVNRRRLETLRTLATAFQPQGVIELVWQGCLTYEVEAVTVQRFVETELKLPYLKLTTDYSPADAERLRLRVEALVETVRRRWPAGGGGR